MKNPKKLTYSMKIKLAELGFNPGDWLRIKSTPDGVQLINRYSGETQTIKL